MQLSPSPNLLKQWNTKLGLSANSNRSQSSDGEEVSTATVVRNFAEYSTEQIPDILKLSHQKMRSGEHRPKSCLELGVFSKPSYKLNEDVTSIAKNGGLAFLCHPNFIKLMTDLLMKMKKNIRTV